MGSRHKRCKEKETGKQRGGGRRRRRRRRREEEKFESRGHNIRKVKQEVWNREDEGEGRKEEEVRRLRARLDRRN